MDVTGRKHSYIDQGYSSKTEYKRAIPYVII